MFLGTLCARDLAGKEDSCALTAKVLFTILQSSSSEAVLELLRRQNDIMKGALA